MFRVLISACLCLLVSCSLQGEGEDRQLQFDLADSLKNYSLVIITAVDIQDSNHVLDTAFADSLPNPKALAVYRVPNSIQGDFRITIQGFDANGLLALQTDIDIKSGSASAPKKHSPEKLPALVAALPTARLLGLEISMGDLIPSFQPGVFSYSVEVLNDVDSLVVNAMAMDSQSTLTLDGPGLAGEALESGIPSKKRALMAGDNLFKVGVLPKGGFIRNLYSLKVLRNPGDEVRLDSIRISQGQTNLAFNSDSGTYAATVADSVDTLWIRPLAKDSKAMVEVDGVIPSSILGKGVALKPGATTGVHIKVTARNGTTVKNYQLNVKRLPSGDAALTGISLLPWVLAPTFQSERLQYSVTVASDAIVVTANSRQPGAVIKINGAEAVNGVANLKDLAVGATTIPVSVTAPDGKGKKEYSLVVNRADPSALLGNLELIEASLLPVFQANQFHFTASVVRIQDKASLKIQVNTQVKAVSVTFNGLEVKEANPTIAGGVKSSTYTGSLKVGLNPIIIEITSADGRNKNMYTVNITRAPSSNADAADFIAAHDLGGTVSTLNPPFNPLVINYTDTLKNASETTEFIWVHAKDSLATRIVRHKRLENELIKGKYITLSTLSLAHDIDGCNFLMVPSTNQVEVEITAEDGITKKVYTITVWKPPSSNSQLSSLSAYAVSGDLLGPLNLTPIFASGTYAYSGSAGAGFIKVKATSPEEGPSITVNGYPVVNGGLSGSLTMSKGSNKVTVICTAPDGHAKSTYILTITH